MGLVSSYTTSAGDMVDRLTGPHIVATSLPPELERGGRYKDRDGEELGSLPGGEESRRASESDSDWLTAQENWLINSQGQNYGSVKDDNSSPFLGVSRRKSRGSKQYSRLDSVSSLTRVCKIIINEY